MKVSVVTAVYNNVAEIETAITSVLSQRGVNVELVVVDGGSTDGTCDVLDRYRNHFGAYVSARDGGIYPALNRGLSLATGDYVGFLHSDDLFASVDALATLFGELGSARPDAVWGDLDYVRKKIQLPSSGIGNLRRLHRDGCASDGCHLIHRYTCAEIAS